jgi:small subunit ribosomal protein S2
MTQPQLKDLLEAGVHFGHQTRRWNPKMRRFIFAERSGIYLIDLQKTLRQLQAAQDLVREVVMRGDGVLFVCTKRQLKEIVRSEAERSESFWVTERWLGGTLTNFDTIKQQIRRLKDIEQGQAEGTYEFFTKKEQLRIDRERVKLNRNLEGIKRMNRLPGALFVVDAQREKIAIAEANKLGIAVVAIVDTNADPDLITIPIPGNDDAIRSVSLITGAMVDVIAEARSQVPLREVVAEGESYAYSSDSGGAGDVEEHRKRRRARRKRRPKPEAIVARLKTAEGPGGEAGAEDADADVGGGDEGEPNAPTGEAEVSTSVEAPEEAAAPAEAPAAGKSEA